MQCLNSVHQNIFAAKASSRPLRTFWPCSSTSCVSLMPHCRPFWHPNFQ
uniref:Uncharacterized protein n=1 Tax=Rhizophora mucronata TaxID=61149 RepID=A0A2P2NNV9_RHIMU